MDVTAPTAPTAEIDPNEIGQRISDLLGGLGAHAEPKVAEAAGELAQLLMEMYGAGLERIVSVLSGAGAAGADLLGRLTDDDLVASLLVLHDLHPEDTFARVTRALESVRPYLGSHAGGVELLGVAHEPAGEVVQLRLQGSCDGCPSSAITVKMAIEKALEEVCHIQKTIGSKIPWLGMYPWGEIAPKGGRSVFSNFQFPLLVLCE